MRQGRVHSGAAPSLSLIPKPGIDTVFQSIVLERISKGFSTRLDPELISVVPYDCAFARKQRLVILSATTLHRGMLRRPQREGSIPSDAIPPGFSH